MSSRGHGRLIVDLITSETSRGQYRPVQTSAPQFRPLTQVNWGQKLSYIIKPYYNVRVRSGRETLTENSTATE